MKRVYLSIVIAAFLYCFSCTNEPIVDTFVSDTSSSGFSLVVKIADSPTKISLGEKVDGEYPVYWSEGDRLWIEGHISNKAVIDESNRGLARFDVPNTEVKYPYNILYPVHGQALESISEIEGTQTFSAATRTTTMTALFSAEQNYVEGTFESGTTPMYGRVKNGNGSVKLNHLSGVLCFSFTGEVTLSTMTLTAEEGALAGEFEVDFESGNITPKSSTVSTINYSFGEGLTLSPTEAKSFFVVVPKGNFGRCTVKLCATNGESMSANFNTAGSLGVKAGVVREYPTLVFRNGKDCSLAPLGSEEDDLIVDMSTYMVEPSVDGEYLVIEEPRQLVWLCYNEPALNGCQYTKVKFAKDIDMDVYSLLALPSAKVYDGTEIDGNNKTITGISMSKEASSIFGDKKNLNIHNLTFTNCAVETAAQTGTGILVGMVSEGLTVSDVTFNNCSVVAPCKIGLVAGALHTGTFNISDVTANGGLIETAYVSGKSGLAGGLVGCFAKNGDGATTSTATFTNCTTSATVKSYMESNNYFYGKMVGQLGGYNGDEKVYFVNCNAAEATLVPLYNQGDKYAENTILTYCEACRADFCEKTLTSATDYLLGGERYCRGEVYVDGERFYAEWDGIRSVAMITESVDGITRYLVQSPYDLATAQAAKYSNTKALVFKSDVDMGGHKFKPIEYVINLDGENHSLYNLKVDVVHNAASNYGAGFIVYANNATTHKDLTFVGADVNCTHDASLPSPAYGVTDDHGEGNAYAGVLVSRSWRTAIKDDAGNTTGYTNYIVSNIHVRDSKVRGVCKVGGLIGACRGQVYMDNCSVDNSTIENYDPKVPNYYTMKKSISASFMDDYIVEGLQWWYTAGECGGLIGFLHAHYAEITNCSVTNSRINCTGQPNKEVVANVWKSSSFTEGAYASGKSITMSATTTIAGRHVNQFIGDLRSSRTETQANNGTGEYTNKILNYTVSGNSYNGVSADGANEYNHNYASGKYCEVVGCAYYTGVDLTILLVSTHVSECAGTLIFCPKGGSEVTLTEAVGSGNNMDWFGGDGKTRSGSSYYPEAPQN